MTDVIIEPDTEWVVTDWIVKYSLGVHAEDSDTDATAAAARFLEDFLGIAGDDFATVHVVGHNAAGNPVTDEIPVRVHIDHQDFTAEVSIV